MPEDPISALLAQLSAPMATPQVPQSTMPKLGLGDALMMAFNPQAMQLFGSVLQMKQHDEDRQFRRQLHQSQMERQRRDDLLQLFQLEQNLRDRAEGRKFQQQKLKADLNDSGAIQGNPQGEEFLTSLFGAPKDPRSRIDVGNESFYLPTKNEQLTTALKQKTAQEEMEIAGAVKKAKALAPIEVDKQKQIEASKYRQPLSQKNVDDEGNVTYDLIDPRTKAIETIKGGGKGKSKTSTDARQAILDARKEYDDAEKRRGEVQKLIDSAKAFDASWQRKAATAKAKDEAFDIESYRRESEDRWANAAREAEAAREQYPDYIEGGAGSGGYPFVKRKVGARPQVKKMMGKQATTTRTPKIMSQAAFEFAVQNKFGGDREKALAEAKRLGYTIQ